MAEKQPTNPQNNSDEIDLGQLFRMIGKGFNSLFSRFLRFFLYLKKNAIILIGLIVLGVVAGYVLSKVTSKKYKTEVIVKPQIDSKNYLYDVIDELTANIKAKDTAFFETIGMQAPNFNGLEITINKVNGEISTENDEQYLEMLKSFEDTDAIADIVRAELQNKSSYNHRITFYYRNKEKSKEFIEGVLRYINTNQYFKGLIAIYRENSLSRIEENKQVLKQLDEIIFNYSKQIAKSESFAGNDRIIMDNKETVNITGLFSLKNSLIADIESKKIEIEQRKEAVRIINLGKTQQVQKQFFGKKIVFIPLFLIGLFFMVSIVRFLNKRAAEII
ncbi:hypothetical protein [Maribacter antarcticus]|uniref:hypothetical protein n=1 Tax=Maribacter antarcticus TaxID=505250 RepID=UPI00047EBCF9|nr:hypothetical protein [Maribacter antarcticus]